MRHIETDIAIIGAGIAGAGVAAELAGEFRVTLIEQEDRPGYHSTGRSAAIFIRNYGNATIRALSRASVPMFEAAGAPDFSGPLLTQRGLLTIASEASIDDFRALMSEADGMVEITVDEACAMVPVLRREKIVAAAFEQDAQDIDVAALHDGWLRKAKKAGAELITGAPLLRGSRNDGGWDLETADTRIRAGIIVNAAGAWADHVATACGVAPLGLQPMRRSMAVIPAPEGIDLSRWPLVDDAAESWYFKPEGTKLYVSPAEEIPVDPHDAFVDDMVLAEGLDRFEQAVNIPVTRVERSWAGLRTFAPDRTPVAGFDSTSEEFFWLAGQGGYGIQTSPALSRLAALSIRRALLPADLDALLPALSPDRLRA
ncbi:FAD-dependent oxidoreductase [Mesorhizobium sp. NBSH29]|uniref:NAD(P)/FAD-dependent oxidoreductase n=1 Tax=Mesorhizobium sp. NBSH29 TaxID=2654249 RepID=UPI0018968A91|nr:FAD-dependent oxidoreductase [Mesorhizobium sp. NBSH29]QPC86905.1 FAD-dependent oxidoreductase [Mesorhizobium sp. NBSH29]